jgi:hypothetical protein
LVVNYNSKEKSIKVEVNNIGGAKGVNNKGMKIVFNKR